MPARSVRLALRHWRDDAPIMIDFAQYMEPVARRLLGEPNRALSTPSQWRYGTHGSMAVEVAGQNGGKWYDHERKIGGGVLDLVRDKLGLSNGAAAEGMKSELDSRLDDQPEPVRERRIDGGHVYFDADGGQLLQVVRILAPTVHSGGELIGHEASTGQTRLLGDWRRRRLTTKADGL